MKSHFNIEDNIIDKKLIKYLDEKTFSSKKNVKNIIDEIVDSFAHRFAQGNKDKAIKMLS